MSIDEFISSVENQTVSFPNCDDNQCMTLMHKYVHDVLGLTDPLILAQPKAAEIFSNFDNTTGHEHFTKVENTPDYVPPQGAIAVWNENEGNGNGHCSIVLDANVNDFISLDCNWPFGSLPHKETHNYANVLGFLIPIQPSETPTEQPAEQPQETPAPDTSVYPYGLDLNNPDSVKVCVDIWKEVEDGHFVRKEEFDALQEKFNELEKQHQDLQTAHAEQPEQIKQDIIAKILAHLGL